jgi:YVTN family beta-propeller protein
MKTTVPNKRFSGRGLPSLITGWRPAFRSLTVLAVLSIAAVLAAPGAAASGTAAPGHVTAPGASPSAGVEYPSAPPPGLLLPGEKVTLTATVELVDSGQDPVGDAFVRGSAHGSFTRLAMTYSENTSELTAKVPARFLRGSIVEDYVVIRDPAGGTPATLPAGGAGAPYRSWIVSHPVTIALGAHTFGKFRKPQAIVARASAGSGPGQVGFFHSPDVSIGPSSVDVARDGTVWVADTVNSRLLAYAPGKPAAPALTVTMPQEPLAVAIAPSGRIYAMAGSPTNPANPRRVYAFDPKGKKLWAHLAGGFIFNSGLRADRDGIPWIDDPDLGWIPVTNRAGDPLTIAQQTRRTMAYQPLGRGRQLPDTLRYPTEDRIGLVSATGALQYCWRLTSQPAFSPRWPQARTGQDIVEFGEVANSATNQYQYEYLIVRFSPAGQVLDKFSLNPQLIYGDDGPFAAFGPLRVGLDGQLYYLQSSDKWGMRVARYNWSTGATTTRASADAAGAAVAAYGSQARPVTAYVAGGSEVTPIRTATNTALTPIKVGTGAFAIAITPDSRTAYVSNNGLGEVLGHTVTPIRTATNTALKNVRVGRVPGDLAITPDGKTVYVVNIVSKTVTPIRTATNTALKPIKVGIDPFAIAITPNGKTAYISNETSSTVTPIRTATNTALKPIKVGTDPFAIAITPDGKTAYITNAGSNTVTPIRTATNTALKPIKVGSAPEAIAITPDGKTAYIANGISGTVTPIRTATNTALKPIKVGNQPRAIAITPDGKTAYVINNGSGTVTPIRTATNTALKPIKVGSAPEAIAITPNGKTAYIANGDRVNPIRTATNKALKAIKVAEKEGAFAIAITP